MTGIPAAPGIALGPIRVIRPSAAVPPPATAASVPPAEAWARVAEALALCRAELAALEADVRRRVGESEAGIFSAQTLMLDDPMLIDPIQSAIRERRLSPPAAVAAGVEAACGLLEGLADPVFRARAADVRDVGQRIVAALGSGDRPATLTFSPAGDGPVIVAALELFPSQTAALDPRQVAGILTERGSATSHAAILARGLGIPAVVGVAGLMAAVRDGLVAAVDGATGAVMLDPSPVERAEWIARQAVAARHSAESSPASRNSEGLEAVTRNGISINLWANAGNEAEVEAAVLQGAGGIGLLRTEFLFAAASHMPDEATQTAVYRRLVQRAAPRPVVVRLLDVGSDKPWPAFPLPDESNPALGLRGIRALLHRPEVLTTQVRALLRAAGAGVVWILLPMVTGLDELAAVQSEVAACRRSLAAEGVAVPDHVPVGVMVETPAAALMAAELSAACDFFSIGTNDLVQHTLAVDRTNPAVAARAEGMDPAVLRLIQMTISAAAFRKIPVEVCGEWGGDPGIIPVLVGLGITRLSMAPSRLAEAARVIRTLDAAAAGRLARRCLKAGSAAAVQEILRAAGRRRRSSS